MTNGQHGTPWYPQNKMSNASTRRRYTVEDWLAVSDEKPYFELIDGELIQKAGGSFAHGAAQGAIRAALGPFLGAPGGAARIGGWWLSLEADIVVGGQVFVPDVAGWRRDRLTARPSAKPVPERPDWVCEILSPSNRQHDTILKLRRYYEAGIPHYWIIDGDERTLTVHRHTPEGYVIALRAGATAHVRAEPFDAIELHVAVLLGDDPADDVTPPAAPAPPP